MDKIRKSLFNASRSKCSCRNDRLWTKNPWHRLPIVTSTESMHNSNDFTYANMWINENRASPQCQSPVGHENPSADNHHDAVSILPSKRCMTEVNR